MHVSRFLSLTIHAAPTALSNGPTIIEAQTDFICDTIAALRAQGATSIEAKAEAEDEWKESMNVMNKYTLYPYTNSWWNGSNIPGKTAENMTYIGGIDNYELQCREKMVGWKGFDVVSSAATQTVPEKQPSAVLSTREVGVEA